MKTILVMVSMFLALSSLAIGETISLDNGNITFEAPDEFRSVPDDLIELKFPSNDAPKYVIGNESAATTIAYDIKPHNIPQDKMAEVQEAFTNLFPRKIPGLKWIKNEIIELSGRKWIFLELTSYAEDTDIHNIMLVTGYKGEMLVFNFNSTKEEFKKYEDALRQSVRTITIN